MPVGHSAGLHSRSARLGTSDVSATDTHKRPDLRNAWDEARELIWAHRKRLALGLTLMLINRLAGLVLPATSKYLIDEVVTRHRG